MVVTTSRSYSTKPPWDKYYFDRHAGIRVIRFIELHCVHVEDGVDIRAGDPVRLQRWQKLIIMKLFSWKRIINDARKFRKLWLEIPRKAGKTSLAAWIILYLLFADGERGAQIVCAASSTEQAEIIFGICKQIVLNSPKLHALCSTYKKSLWYRNLNNVFKVLSGRPSGKHGKNLHGAVVDEVHEQKSRELIEALSTSNIARKQPLEIYITTAGDDPTSICWEMHEHAVRVIENPKLDEQLLPKIYTVDVTKDPEAWKDEKNWYKANPNLGVTFPIEKMREDFELAEQVPAYENSFKRLRLNIWTEQETRAIPMDKWRRCQSDLSVDRLKRRPCWMGLDIAATTDVAAGVLVFPPRKDEPFYDALSFFWYPRLSASERRRTNKKDLLPWAQQGLIKLTEGNVIDQDVIRKDINALRKIYNIREIAIDRWNSVQLQTQLQGDGFEVIQFGQGFGSMTDPTKQLIGLVLDQRLNHYGNPVLEWMASYFAVEMNAAGDIKPSKKKAREKIDGMVALIMALSRAMLAGSNIETQIGNLVVMGGKK